jgi:hypothetical protein
MFQHVRQRLLQNPVARQVNPGRHLAEITVDCQLDV